MVTFSHIKVHRVTLNLQTPFITATQMIVSRHILLLECVGTDGSRVYSECVAQDNAQYVSETIDDTQNVLTDCIIPAVIDRPFSSTYQLNDFLSTQFPSIPIARAAVEMAGWALTALQSGVSLAQALGQACHQVSRPFIDSGIVIGIPESDTDLIAAVQAALNKGYKKIKLKIKPGFDSHPIRVIRDRFGGRCPLMVDANGSYTPDDLPVLKALDRFELLMIEQPFAASQWHAHEMLQAQLNTPICLDESITCLADVKRAHFSQSMRIATVKPGKLGGFTETLAIARFCAEHSIPLWCGGMLESGVGRGYNVALASLSAFTLPGDISESQRYFKSDIVKPEWTLTTDGLIEVSDIGQIIM